MINRKKDTVDRQAEGGAFGSTLSGAKGAPPQPGFLVLKGMALGGLLFIIGACAGRILTTDSLRLLPASLPSAGADGEVRFDSSDSQVKVWTDSGAAWEDVSLGDDPILTGTGSVTVPTGTTAQRPGSPAAGMLRFNSDDTTFEGYDGSVWDVIPSASTAVPTGALAMWFSSTAPSGWLYVDGSTIGSASSGADYADAQYETLFGVLWGQLDNTALPILDSGGSPSTRGASAAADFAADKRLPLPNMEALVPRGIGTQTVNARTKTGPTIGLPQEDAFQGHRFFSGAGMTSTGAGRASIYGHTTSGAPGSATGIAESAASPTATNQPLTSLPQSDGSNGTPRTTDETQVSSFGVAFIIKY